MVTSYYQVFHQNNRMFPTPVTLALLWIMSRLRSELACPLDFGADEHHSVLLVSALFKK